MKYFIPIFIILPAVEIGVLLWSGVKIGIGNTVLIIMLTGILGVIMAKKQGIKVMYKIREAIQNGIPPGDMLIDSFCIFVGGLLLILPGFVTDIFGLLLLLPPIRILIKPKLIKWLKNRANKRTTIIIR